MDTPQNWREFVSNLGPDFMRGYWGERLMGNLALTADILSEWATQAHRSGLVTGGLLHADFLRLIGLARSLPQYPAETNAQYQARLGRAWADWQLAGTDASIIGQLGAAGIAGATIVTHTDRRGPHGEAAPYWSQFWVGIPAASLNLVPPVWGRMIWGTFWWGTAMVERSQAQMFWTIVRKFKPTDWFCRGIELI